MKRFLEKTAIFGIAQIVRPLPAFSPKERLQILLELDNKVYSLEGASAAEYGNGIHTKDKHINYHRFFIENLKPGERILDIGCGNGLMDYNIVTRTAGAKVVGIDKNRENIEFAKAHYRHGNLRFVQGNALEELPNEKFDVVVLSNVLEHFEQRVKFLKNVVKKTRPKRLIIRVPSFERDWRVPLKKELGIDYRLDATHCIEYRQEEYFRELDKAGLEPMHTEFKWGEIWSVAKPRGKSNG